MTTKTPYLTLLLSLLACLVCHAQERLTYLDWAELTRDTLCPTYAEVVPLETDHRANTYTVRLDYPTWAPLTPHELVLAKQHEHRIAADLEVQHYVSVSRGQGLLNYSFVPIVRHGRGYRKLVSAQISIVPTPRPLRAMAAAGTASQRYARESVLSTGTWRKIHIKEDGIYRLTASFLAELGFTDPNRVQLFGYGGHQQSEALDADRDWDDLEEVPLLKAPSGDLLFWGNGLVRWEGAERIFNAYATEATYFLRESADVRGDISTEPTYTGTVNQSVGTTLGHALHEVDDYAWFRAGRNLVESTVWGPGASRSISFNSIKSVGGERLTVVFTGGNVQTPLTISVNDKTVTSGIIPAAREASHDYYTEGRFANLNIAQHKAEGGTWRVTLSTKATGTPNDRVQGRLDYVALNYTAPLTLVEGFVRFGDGLRGTGEGTGGSPLVTETFSGPTRFYGIGGGKNICVMRIGKRGKPASLLSTTQSEDGIECSVADGTESFVAFDPSHAFPTPVAGEAIDNQNLHAIEQADMVIIIPTRDKFREQAERLAQAHRDHDGLTCEVVSANQIYNEFSSGTPDATAYRRFMKMLYDRGLESGRAPRYLLLLGDAAWDNRMKSQTWRAHSPQDYLLCYESENSWSDTKSYCWEDYFGLMDDGEGMQPFKDIPDVAIGRFPVSTEAQAKVMVDKTIAHIQRQAAGEWCNRVVMLGDDGDENTHMEETDIVATRIEDVAPDLDVRKVMWDNYTLVNQGLYNSYPEVRALVEKHLKEGALMFNYTGHAATYLLSHERVVTLNDVKAWNTQHPPLWFTAACDVAPFDSQEDNIGEAAVLNPTGAVAFIGTTHTVYSTPNLYLNRYFSQYLFEKNEHGEHNSVGEALRQAKGSMVASGGDSGQPQNKLQYALLGDPALFFGRFQAHVVLDSIDGVAVNGEQTLGGGSRVRLSGHVERTPGVVDEGFHGVLNFRLYDAIEKITTRENVQNRVAEAFTFDYRSKEINSGTDSIRGGRFSTTVVIPKDISYSNQSGRLVFFARNAEGTLEANGSSEDFLIGGFNAEAQTDTLGPEMFVYLNEPDFQDGAVVGPNPVFVAELKDESGIQYNGNGIGHNLQLCIDGDPRLTFDLNEYYRGAAGDYSRGTVIYNDMPELTEGAHWLSFRAWDMLNNTTCQTLGFVVGEDLRAEVLNLMLEDDVVSGQTNFHIAYNFPGLECAFRLEIYAPTGAVVWRREVKAASDSGIVTIPWDGHNGNGAALGTGIYICRVSVSYGDGKTSHREKKFVLRGNK